MSQNVNSKRNPHAKSVMLAQRTKIEKAYYLDVADPDELEQLYNVPNVLQVKGKLGDMHLALEVFPWPDEPRRMHHLLHQTQCARF